MDFDRDPSRTVTLLTFDWKGNIGENIPTFKCKHIGYNCSFEANATSEDELMKKIVEHAQMEHGLKSMILNIGLATIRYMTLLHRVQIITLGMGCY